MPDNKHKWSLTRLPPAVRILFKGMPGVWRHRHQLLFHWLIVMQIVTSGPRTLAGLSQAAPGFITEWRFRRLLSAGYWSLKVLLHWFAEETIKSLPAPDDHVLYVIVDGSKKDKRGQKNPAAQKGRLSQHHAWFFGIKFIVLMVAWENYRIPVDFHVVLPKDHPDYRKENALFRDMLSHFTPPGWARWVGEKIWHESQKSKKNGDGSLEMTFRVAGLDEIKRWVLSLGPECQVLEPSNLREMVRADLYSTLAIYPASRVTANLVSNPQAG